MKTIGIVLAVAGLLALIYGGFTYTRDRKVIDVGPIEAHVDQKERVPISPLVGAVVLIAGLAFVFMDRKRTA